MASTETPVPLVGLPSWTRIGFTGHRRLENRSQVEDLLKSCLADLQQQYGSLVSISSAAEGGDQLFLAQVQAQQMPCGIVLPFGRERFSKDFSPAAWAIAEQQINGAVELRILDDCESDEDAYLEAGILTVDGCDILIAVWDGLAARGKGGTADIVAYARQRQKPLIIIDPNSLVVTRERMPTPASVSGNLQSATLESITAAFHHYDTQANLHGPKATRLAIHIISLHLFASGLAITGLVLPMPDWLKLAIDFGKLGALVFAWLLVIVHHKNQHHWTYARPTAELLRFFMAIWPLKSHTLTIKPSMLTSLTGVFRNLSISWRARQEPDISLDEGRARYIQERIDPQIHYYRHKLDASSIVNRFTHSLSNGLTLFAIAACVIAIALKFMHQTGIAYDLAKLASILVPLLIAALLAIGVAQDTQRRLVRYRNMLEVLQRSRDAVSLAPGWPSLWRAIEELEHEIMNEVEEWHSLARFSSSH